MTFNSFLFFLTLAPLLAFHAGFRSTRPRLAKIVVLLYSFMFYAAWNAWFLIPLGLSTFIDYRAALAMGRWPRHRKWFLAASLTANLGLLGTFKYFNFFADGAAWAVRLAGLSWQPPHLGVLLPVGMSFYTFEAMSYTIDVYRGVLEPRRSLLDVALFVAYFPHLVAGPIVRARLLLPQFERGPRLRATAVADGLFLVLLGLFAKCVVADNAATRVNALFATWQGNSSPQEWAAAMLFGVQIYGDFAGYSAIAIGLARIMGYTIPANFNFPYAAAGFTDFWRRWHISLSSWLRDYLYISLGGNRRSAPRTLVNLMTTMVLGGLWHGAHLRFVVWGGMHGLYLCGERLGRGRFQPPQFLTAAAPGLTFLAVSATWIPFRALTMAQCSGMLGRLLSGPWRLHRETAWDFAAVAAVLAFDMFWARRRLLPFVARHGSVRAALICVMLLGLYFCSGKGHEFIYFRF